MDTEKTEKKGRMVNDETTQPRGSKRFIMLPSSFILSDKSVFIRG
jgi:hypothetical protein